MLVLTIWLYIIILMQRWPETFRYVGVNFLECDDWFNGHGEMTSDAEYYDFEPVGRRTCVYINVVRKNDKKSSIANEEEKMERGREGVSVCVYLCAVTFRSEANRMVAAAETCRDNYCTPVYCTHSPDFIIISNPVNPVCFFSHLAE